MISSRTFSHDRQGAKTTCQARRMTPAPHTSENCMKNAAMYTALNSLRNCTSKIQPIENLERTQRFSRETTRAVGSWIMYKRNDESEKSKMRSPR